MKTLLILLLFIGFGVQSQQVRYVTCETDNILHRNEVKSYKKIVFQCAYYFLMEDNSVMTLRGMEGIGELVRSDAGGGELVPELGIDRREGDVNPKLILVGCPSLYENLIIGANIDVRYKGKCNE